MKHGRDVPILVPALVVLLPDLRQRRVSIFLPWDLGEVDRFSALELGVVKPVGCCGAEVVAHRG
jgi:hypothetical protein